MLGGPFATATAIAAVMALPRYGMAGPTGGTVVGGSATISSSGSVTTINQSTNNAIINWLGFSIAPSETVNFNQPSAASATLNRVIGNEQSVISGALNANGQVFIVNSAGVLFTRGAQVNVGGLVASTLDISNQNFMAGNYTFSGSSSASIVNQGRIHANPGGYVALLGKTVSNDGVIVANLGTVAMASGDKITLNFSGNSLVDVTIDQGTLNALVENKRAIIANGGRVILTARAADQILSAQVNNSGIIQARTMASLKGGTRVVHKGSIKLLAQGGTVTVTGKLDASAPRGGDGGTIETSGSKVKIADSAVITTKSVYGKNGSWLIDPDGFTIAPFGGDITGAKLSSELALTDVTIASTSGHGTSGNIDVNDVVHWSAGTTLTLNATNAISINAVITAPNGGLVLNAGTDININAPSSLQVATITATAALGPAGTGDINFNAPQVFPAAGGTWTFSGININVNDVVNWSAGTLTLNAGVNGGFINLNASMTASGTANLVLTYNTGIDASVITLTDSNGNSLQTLSPTAGTPFGGINPLLDTNPASPTFGTFIGRIDFTNTALINNLPVNGPTNPLTINGQPYTLITSIGQPANPHDLSVIDANGGTGFYALATNLTAPSTPLPAGPVSLIAFGSVFEGLGHNIDGLNISAAPFASNNGLGLISLNEGTVRDISLTNVSVTGQESEVGALVGQNLFGNIINAAASGGMLPDGTVAATGGVTVLNPTTQTGGLSTVSNVGGLVGDNFIGDIYGGWANVHVTTLNVTNVGGLAGETIGDSFPGDIAVIRNSTSIGQVDVTVDNGNFILLGGGVGGLVGSVQSGTLSNDFSSSVVNVGVNVLVGGTGAFVNNVGGLVGLLDGVTFGPFGGTVFNSSAAGRIVVTGNGNLNDLTGGGQVGPIGGFAGTNLGGAIINSSSFTVVPAGRGAFVGTEAGTPLSSGNTFNPGSAGTNSPGDQIHGNGGQPVGVTATTATGPSPGQGTLPSNAQQAANARAQARALTLQATTQQIVVGQNPVAGTAANVATTAALTRAASPPTGSLSAAGTAAATVPSSLAINANLQAIETGVQADDQRARRRVIAAATAAPRRGGGGDATIRNLEINGKPINVPENNTPGGAPRQNPR
jgi:filamentous hemagglutinin family protein